MKSKSAFLVTICLILIFFIARFGLYSCHHMTCSALSIALYPLGKMQQKLTTYFQSWQYSRLTHKQLNELVNRLRKQNKELVAQTIALRSTLLFGTTTYPMIEFQQRYNHDDAQLAQVIFRTVNDHEQTMLIDRGSYHGVSKDMVVIWYNHLIGRVEEVFPFFSKVILVTDKRCNIAAYCPQTKAHGIVQGLNDSQFLALCYVDHLSVIESASEVISSGQGLIFPQGFSLGTIAHYQKGPLYYTITIKLPYDLREVDYCHLLLKGESEGRITV